MGPGEHCRIRWRSVVRDNIRRVSRCIVRSILNAIANGRRTLSSWHLGKWKRPQSVGNCSESQATSFPTGPGSWLRNKQHAKLTRFWFILQMIWCSTKSELSRISAKSTGPKTDRLCSENVDPRRCQEKHWFAICASHWRGGPRNAGRWFGRHGRTIPDRVAAECVPAWRFQSAAIHNGFQFARSDAVHKT